MSSKKAIQRLKEKTIYSTMQLIVRELIMKGIAIIGQILLIRLLTPSAFGVFAILSFALNTAEVLTDIGMNLSIIQRKKTPTKNELSTIFFIKVILTLFIIAFLNILVPFLLSPYHQFTESEILMFRVLTLTLLLKPLQSLLISLMERNLRYKEIAIIDLTGMVSYYTAAILLAVSGFGIWSFIWAVVVKSLVESVITFGYSPWLPILTFNLKGVKDYIKIGKYFQLGLIVGIVHNSIIPVLGGTKLPLSHVGFLDWSFNMASFPRIFIDNLGRVIFASFSRIQDNKKVISAALEEGFEILSLITIFVIGIVIIFGHDSIHFFLTDKWLPALPALYWYVGSIYFMNGTGLLGHALFAIGKAKNLVISIIFLTAFEIISAYWLLLTVGFTGIAISFFITSLLTFITYLWLCFKEQIYVNLTRSIIVSSGTFIISILLFYLIHIYFSSTPITLIIKLSFASLMYLAILRIISPQSIEMITKLLKNRR